MGFTPAGTASRECARRTGGTPLSPRGAPSVLRLFRRIGLPHLWASWGRSALVAGGAATGVALIVAIHVVNASVLANFRRTIEEAAGPAALEVTLGTGEIGFPEDALEVVRADPGVVAAVPLVRGTLTLADDADEALQLFGVDVMADGQLDRYHISPATDRRALGEALLDPRSLLVARDFAERRAVRIGDVLTVSSPTGIAELRVRGLLEAGGLARAVAGSLAVMDLPAAQLLLGKAGRLDQVDVMVAPGAGAADCEALEARLRARLPATLSVRRPAQRGALYDRILSSFQTMLVGLSLLCLVAGTYITYNTTSTGAVHRALAFAGLRVTGADRRQLFGLLMLEALLLGTAGTAAGIPAGVALARVLGRLVTESMGVIFQLRFAFEELVVSPREHLWIAALGVEFAIAIQLLIVVITVAGIFDLLVAAIVERRRELAVWRVMGADAAAVRRAVTLESAAIGALGSVLGIAVGVVTARIWVEIHYKYLLGYHLEPHFAARSAAWYMTLVLVMTVATGYGAARYATRQSILGGIQTP